MKHTFEHLLELCEKLRGPNGCPWDKAQTIESLVKDFEEEADEMKEAIKNKDMVNLEEEIGDVCFTLALIMQIAREEKIFTPESVFKEVSEKIITRHSWVFGDDKVESIEEAVELWKKNKEKHKKEKATQHKKENI